MVAGTRDDPGPTVGDPPAPVPRWVDRVPGSAVGLALVATSLVAVLDLVLPPPVAGVLAAGSSIAAVTARPRAVLGVGAYGAALVLVLALVDGPGQRGTTVTDLVTVAVVAAVGALLADRRIRLETAGAAVARRHADLAAVVDSCDDGIVGLTLDGTVTSWNGGAERLTGRGADRAVGVPILRFVGQDARETVAQALEAIRVGRPAPHYNASRTGVTGTMLHVSVAWSPVHDAAGRVIGASAVFRDMYEREQERRVLQDRVRQFERLESLGKLVGGIAHDFNNLMAIVLSYAEFVESATRHDPVTQADVGHIRGAAERAAALTRHLLTFARRRSTHAEVLSVDRVLADTVPLLSRTLGPRVQLELRGTPESTLVRADVARLEQAVVNLAVNGGDAMPTGGRLTIANSVVQLDGDHAWLNPPPTAGCYVVLEVSDTGTGMVPDVAAHAFEPFFTTKDEAAGTGLGLATVWGIVTELGGSLGVRSRPGSGSVFSLYLPRAEPEPATGRAPRSAPDPAAATPSPVPAVPVPSPVPAVPVPVPAGQPGSVLVVEDEDPLRELVSRVLRRSGYEVVAEANGADALAVASRRDFDLLFTDVVMPGMSGPDVAAAVRDLHPTIRVLYTSGYTRGALGQDHLLEEDVDVLPKPFTHAGLVERVTAALERSPG